MVFDLEYDSGVGNCRKELTKRTDEEFLMYLDPDMTCPDNYQVLKKQLKANPEIGAISGLILERSRVFTSACDIKEKGNNIHKGIWEDKEISSLNNAPFVTFDFIPQVGVFRRECLQDYTWDDYYRTQREHIDFFMGHKRETEWVFGICPKVLFPHFPGGSQKYMDHRMSEEKRSQSHSYFCDKWNCDGIISEINSWVDTYPYYVEPDLRQRVSTQFNRARTMYREEGLLKTFQATIRHIFH